MVRGDSARKEKYSLDAIPDPSGDFLFCGRRYRLEEKGDVDFGRQPSASFGGRAPRDTLLAVLEGFMLSDLDKRVLDEVYSKGKGYHTYILERLNPRFAN